MTAQSAVIVLDLLERGDVSTWVAGGWGVDALVGRESRPHADLDLLIPVEMTSRARQSLTAAGFVDSLDELPTRFEMSHQKFGVVDLHPIHGDANGTHRLQLPNGASWVYSDGALDALGRIESRRCRCLSAREQLRLHDGYELREIDHGDISLLRSLLARPASQMGDRRT
jgi:Aminoglycoside-2''-adenylyltransferase